MPVIEQYEHVDMGGNHIAVELRRNEAGRWSVVCWQGPDAENLDLHWEMHNKVTKMSPDGNRILEAIPYDETLAREEFERWRPK